MLPHANSIQMISKNATEIQIAARRRFVMTEIVKVIIKISLYLFYEFKVEVLINTNNLIDKVQGISTPKTIMLISKR